jgi:hypothetical protein
MTRENLLELSLSLLDDANVFETSKQLEVFADSEKWVEDSLFVVAAEKPSEPSPVLNEQEHIVFANNLNQRYTRQKLQNETLIKALQNLRERMNDSKQRSAKASS